MKFTSTIQTPYFFYPGASSDRRPARRRITVRPVVPTPIETSDELERKQEVVCGAILALSLVSTVVMCLWQLVGF